MFRKVTRRDFIRTTGTVATAAMFMPHLARAEGANEKLNIANIGVGGRGGAHLGAAGGQNLVAICDIDEGRLGGVAKRFPKAKPYTDYRKMLEEMKEIDAVMVATPDHSHFPASMMAIQMGKHVFCEKPLTHSVQEARRIAAAAREKKVATQMGNQGHSGEGNRRLCEYIWDGAIGAIREVHAWSDRPAGWWPQGVDRPKDTPECPKTIHWDEWIGPAPMRPYHPAYLPFKWRGWIDFGCGALGDMGCHIMDGAVWALKLGDAKTVTVSAESSGMNKETFPAWSVVTYEFPARGDMPACKLVWHDGKKMPPRPQHFPENGNLGGNGSYFVGERGEIFSGGYGGCQVMPDELRKEYKPPAKTIPRGNMHGDWIRACKGGEPASSAFDVSAGRLTEIVLLGCVALRAGEKITYDFTTGNLTSPKSANGLLSREYRKGWDF